MVISLQRYKSRGSDLTPGKLPISNVQIFTLQNLENKISQALIHALEKMLGNGSEALQITEHRIPCSVIAPYKIIRHPGFSSLFYILGSPRQKYKIFPKSTSKPLEKAEDT